MMNRQASNIEEVDLNIVGSFTFGKYSTISAEKTINYFISDGWLVNYAGYLSVIKNLVGNGRGINVSLNNTIISVFGNTAYLINITYNQLTDLYSFSYDEIGTLLTSTGNVYIAENIINQIIFSDSQHLYLYDPANITNPFQVLVIDFVPGKIIYHNGYFICNSI